MPTTNKGLEQPAASSTNWDVPLNANFGYIDSALGGTTTKSVTGVSATPVVLTASEYRSLILNFTGTLTANVTYQIPSGVGGEWIVSNNTTGAFTLTIDNVATGASAVIPSGTRQIVYSDGTNVYAVQAPATGAGASGQVAISNGSTLITTSGLTFNTGTSVLSVTGTVSITGAITSVASIVATGNLTTSGGQVRAGAFLDASGGNTATINGKTPLGTSDIASQAQAEAGTDNSTLMTPLRSQQMFVKRTFPNGTTTNVTASRALATNYQNTTDGWLFVAVTCSNNGQSLNIGPTIATMRTMVTTNVAGGTIGGFIPSGAYYSVSGGGLTSWFEG